VVNAGIGGGTSSDGLERLEQVIALHPAVAIVELGPNDGLRGIPVATTRANLEQIVAALQGRSTRRAGLIPCLLEGVAGVSRYMQRDGLHANVEGIRRAAANVMRTLAPLL
jgi:acyl-CoA thioesterase-1